MLFREDLEGTKNRFSNSSIHSLNRIEIAGHIFAGFLQSECNLCFWNWKILLFLNWHHFPCIVWEEISISPHFEQEATLLQNSFHTLNLPPLGKCCRYTAWKFFLLIFKFWMNNSHNLKSSLKSYYIAEFRKATLWKVN